MIIIQRKNRLAFDEFGLNFGRKTINSIFQPEMPYEPEPDTGENDEEEAPDIHTLKKNFEILHTNQNQGN